MSLDKAEKLQWAFLIKKGEVYNEHSYYGGFDTYSKKARKQKEKCLEGIGKQGIDWEKTEPVEDDEVHEFTDTFNDPAIVKYMQGTLVLKDGRSYKWLYEMEDSAEVFKVATAMAALDLADIGG